MHILGAVLLWLLLGLLLLAVLALIVPLGLELEYKEGRLAVRLCLFGIAVPIYPRAETTAKHRAGKKEKKQEKEPKEPTDTNSKKKKLSLEEIKAVFEAAGHFMKRVFRALHITKIILIIPVQDEDAAKTALRCAEVQAGVGAAAAFFNNFLHLRFECVHILPNFTGDIKAGPYFSCKVSALPIIMITAAVYAVIRLKDKLPAKQESADKTMNQLEGLK